MPAAIALAGAAFSVSAGLTAGGILGGMMVAGGALSALGTITGNKKLGKIGSVLGLVGGVGNLAQGLLKETAGQAATQAATEGAASTAGNTIADAAGTAGDVASMATDVAANAANATSGSAALAGDIASADANMINSALASPAQQALSPQSVLMGPQDAFSAAGNPLAQQVPLGMGYGAPVAGPVAEPGILAGAWQNSAVGQTANSWIDKAKGAVEGVSKWTKANPEMAKVGGGLIQGAANHYSYTEAQKDAFKRQQQYADWVRQKYSDSVRNLQIPNVTAPLSQGIIGGAKG